MSLTGMPLPVFRRKGQRKKKKYIYIYIYMMGRKRMWMVGRYIIDVVLHFHGNNFNYGKLCYGSLV